MASPLSQLSNTAGAMNQVATPPTTTHNAEFKMSGEQQTLDSPPGHAAADDDTSSSPFMSRVDESRVEGAAAAAAKEVVSPTRNNRNSRIMSGHGVAPLRILSTRDDNAEAETRSPTRPAPSSKRNSRILPVNRFPVKISNGSGGGSTPETKSPEAKSPEEEKPPPPAEKEMNLETAIKDNPALKEAIKIFEDDDDTTVDDDDADTTEADHPYADEAPNGADDTAGPDESMVSTFSNFSAVPNMTMFAKLGHTPSRFANMGPVPHRGRPDASPSRTPRPPAMHDSGHTTPLMDFGDHYGGGGLASRYGVGATSPTRHRQLSPAKTAAGTPQRQNNNSNLLDFDIPPLPTPRSVPTVTPREVESLKSSFLSEISSLKASLMGKEAEVSSLKTAVGDAEKRVGECMEQLRETQGIRDAFAEEKESWERRGREMEAVLRKVKTDMVGGQREREELEYKIVESEQRREAAEMMAQEAESKMAGMRAGKMPVVSAGSDSPADCKSPDRKGAREVELAVERVARELHALYKSKHETKVTALKKSYEHRWEKRVAELEQRIEELLDDKEALLRDAAAAGSSKVDPAVEEERMAQAAKASAQIKELDAEIMRLEATVGSVKQDNHELIQLLERERVEKGELVQLAEEMMEMQHTFVQQQPPPPQQPQPPAQEPPQQHHQQQHHQAQHHQPQPQRHHLQPQPTPLPAPTKKPTPSPNRYSMPAPARPSAMPTPNSKAALPTPNNRNSMHTPPKAYRSSIGRPGAAVTAAGSGLRAPGTTTTTLPKSQTEGSRVGAGAGIKSHQSRNSGIPGGGLPRPGSGLARPGSGLGTSSRNMMSSIQQMGSYRGRDAS